MILSYLASEKAIATAKGLWLIHGGEPVLSQRLQSSLRDYWQQKGFERHRLDISQPSEFEEVIQLLFQPSLFADKMAIEIHTTQKPSPEAQRKIEHWTQDDEGHHVVIFCPDKLDKKQFQHTWFRSVEVLGVVVNAFFDRPQDQFIFLTQLAKQFEFQLTPEAWQFLQQQTENNLLASYQMLLNLSYGKPQQTVTIEQLQAVLSQQSNFQSFALTDAILAKNHAKIILILNQLKESDTAPSLVLWTLSRDAKAILTAKFAPQQFADLTKSLGIWSSKQGQYILLAQQLSVQKCGKIPQLLLKLDESIKGISSENVWDLFELLSLQLSGLEL